MTLDDQASDPEGDWTLGMSDEDLFRHLNEITLEGNDSRTSLYNGNISTYVTDDGTRYDVSSNYIYTGRDPETNDVELRGEDWFFRMSQHFDRPFRTEPEKEYIDGYEIITWGNYESSREDKEPPQISHYTRFQGGNIPEDILVILGTYRQEHPPWMPDPNAPVEQSLGSRILEFFK